ncbi:Uncharacterised protein [Streptococcus pneumoniae]|nr:Uncharacterised protein [Streptococcus pneumoniae]
MCFTHSFFHFATLRKSLQTTSRRLTVCMVTDFVSSILQPQNHVLSNLRQFYLQPQNHVLSYLRLAS